MIQEEHFASPEIGSTLTNLNHQWADLSERARDKGEKLRQAAQQELFNKALQDAEAKLAEMEKMVASDDIGKDLRGVKNLLKKHQVISISIRGKGPQIVRGKGLQIVRGRGHKLERGHKLGKGATNCQGKRPQTARGKGPQTVWGRATNCQEKRPQIARHQGKWATNSMENGLKL